MSTLATLMMMVMVHIPLGANATGHTVFVRCQNQNGPPMAVEVLPETTVGDLKARAAAQDSRFEKLVPQWNEEKLTDPQRLLADIGIGGEITVDFHGPPAIRVCIRSADIRESARQTPSEYAFGENVEIAFASTFDTFLVNLRFEAKRVIQEKMRVQNGDPGWSIDADMLGFRFVHDDAYTIQTELSRLRGYIGAIRLFRVNCLVETECSTLNNVLFFCYSV